MTQRLGSLVALATGAFVLHLVLAHGLAASVKPSAGPLLLLVAWVLCVAGGAGLLARD